MYQRRMIQDDSMYYEHRKYDGSIGLNTFLGGKESHATGGEQQLRRLQQVARERGNTFEVLMEAAKSCSLGSISHAFYEVGGEYRRNI